MLNKGGKRMKSVELTTTEIVLLMASLGQLYDALGVAGVTESNNTTCKEIKDLVMKLAGSLVEKKKE